MKYIVKYKLWGKKIPFFIKDGGYFYSNGVLIGITHDDKDCYIPSDIEKISTKTDLENYITSLNIKKIDENNKEISLSNEKKQKLADKYWTKYESS